jgi:heme exporter protein C
MLRSYVLNPGRAATLAAVVAIMGFVDVPIVYMSIRWWRTQHPQPVIGGGEGSGLDASMWVTLLVSWGAFLCLYAFLVRERLALAGLQRGLSALRREWSATAAKEERG